MNNNNDGGCLAAILAFMFIGGNIFLFTGALTDDLNDNGFAWIMVVVAIIADLVIFCWLASKLQLEKNMKIIRLINLHKTKSM